MRDYRRAGLELPKAQRDEVEQMRKELTRLTTDFESNVTKAQKAVKFTKAELEGVPESFLAQVKTGDDEYTVMANITWHYLSVMDNAKREETRKKLLARARQPGPRGRTSRCWRRSCRCAMTSPGSSATRPGPITRPKSRWPRTPPRPLISWRSSRPACSPSSTPSWPSSASSRSRRPATRMRRSTIWDWRYFSNQLKKEKYNVDAEQLRVYFPYQRVLDGMFNIYQSIFGLKFERVEPPYKWIGDLQLYAVSDAKTGEPLGSVLPRHVPARRQIQSLRPFPPHRGQAAGRRQIPAPDRRADLQLPLAHQGQALAAFA